MRFAAIADWADSGDFDVAMMCSWLGVSRAGYYKWRNTRPSTRAVLDAHLSEIIAAVHAAGRGNPGVRRVWAELRARGYRVAKKRVWKLMKAAGLRGRHPKAWKKTTLAAARPVGAPDLIGRDFQLIHTRPWPNIAALRTATVEWIEAYYNTTRRHSYLGYLTPREIELGYTHINHIAA